MEVENLADRISGNILDRIKEASELRAALDATADPAEEKELRAKIRLNNRLLKMLMALYKRQQIQTPERAILSEVETR